MLLAACRSPCFLKNAIRNSTYCCSIGDRDRRLAVNSRKFGGEDLFRYGLDDSDFDLMRAVPVYHEEDSDEWSAYLLLSCDSKRTYVGITRNVRRRVRQHNGELTGGSKSGRTGRPWSLICTIQSFETRSEASQFEFKWKSVTRSVTGFKTGNSSEEFNYPHVVKRRQAALEQVLETNNEWRNSLTIEWHELPTDS